MDKYQWKMQFIGKKIDADLAVQEFERIGNNGSLTPEKILEVASDPANVLHSLFNWDDREAAHKYRLIQARILINNITVTVVSDGKEKTLDVFEVVPVSSGLSYKNIESFTQEDFAFVKQSVSKGLRALGKKLEVYDNYRNFSSRIEDIANELDSF